MSSRKRDFVWKKRAFFLVSGWKSRAEFLFFRFHTTLKKGIRRLRWTDAAGENNRRTVPMSLRRTSCGPVTVRGRIRQAP